MSSVARKRMGIIVPSSNTIVEFDFGRVDPPTISTHFARTFLAETSAAAEQVMIEEHVPQAAVDLGSARVSLVVFACTSAGSVLGVGGESELIEHLSELAGAPIVSTNEAVARSLQEAVVVRVAVITPYVDELSEAIAATLEERGVQVVAIEGMGITDNYEIAKVTPDQIVEFARDRLPTVEFNALFASCTNLRAMESMADLEHLFGKPAVTSNSAALEAVLSAAGS